MNEMITLPRSGEKNNRIDVSFGTNSQGRIADFTNRLPTGDTVEPRNLENEFNRKALEQTFNNSPDTQAGGNGGNNNLPPNKVAGGFEEPKDGDPDFSKMQDDELSLWITSSNIKLKKKAEQELLSRYLPKKDYHGLYPTSIKEVADQDLSTLLLSDNQAFRKEAENEFLRRQQEIRILKETPVTSAALGDFHDEIKKIKTEINNSKKPEKQGFFAKIGNRIGNSLNNFKHDVQNGLLEASIGNVLGIKQVHKDRNYAELNEQVAELQTLANSVSDPDKKQEILARIDKLTGNIANTARTLDLISKQTGEPIETVAKNAIYDRYENTQNIIEARKKGFKALGFFLLGLATGGTGNLFGAAAGLGARVSYAGYADRDKLTNKKTEEYRREELTKVAPELKAHLNQIQQKVLDGEYSNEGIQQILGYLQELLVIQEGKLPLDIEEELLKVSTELYDSLGQNYRAESTPQAEQSSRDFKNVIDNLRVTIDPDIAKQVVQELHKEELNKATREAVGKSVATSLLAIAGGSVIRNVLQNGGIDANQAVTDLTSKLSKGPLVVNGDNGVEGAILATHETPDVTKLNQVLGTNYTDISQLQTRQIGELTIYSPNISGIDTTEIQNSITKAVIPDTEELFREDNVTSFSEHIKTIKPDEVDGNVLTFRNGDSQISFEPGTSRNILDDDQFGLASVVGKDANGDLVVANVQEMDTTELAELRKIMEQPGARYFAEQAEQVQQANIKDFFGIGDAQGLGGEALRKQAMARVGGSDPVAITKEMFRIRAEANIGAGNAEAFANAQMQALKEATGNNYEQFVTAAANGEQIKVDSGLTKSVYQKLLDQFPQYKTFITEQARWTNGGDGLPFQSVQGISTEATGITEQNISGLGAFGWLNDRSNDLSNVFKNLPSPIPQEVKDFLAKAAPGMVYGGAGGAAIGGASGVIKGFRTSGPGFGAKAGGVARGLFAGGVRGAAFGALGGGVAGGFGVSKEAAGLLGLGASLATKTWTGALWNAGNNPTERLFGAAPARPAQAPANQPTPLTPEQQNQVIAEVRTFLQSHNAQQLLATGTVDQLGNLNTQIQAEITRRNGLPEAERNNPVNREIVRQLGEARGQINTRIAELEAQEVQNQPPANNENPEDEANLDTVRDLQSQLRNDLRRYDTGEINNDTIEEKEAAINRITRLNDVWRQVREDDTIPQAERDRIEDIINNQMRADLQEMRTELQRQITNERRNRPQPVPNTPQQPNTPQNQPNTPPVDALDARFARNRPTAAEIAHSNAELTRILGLLNPPNTIQNYIHTTAPHILEADIIQAKLARDQAQFVLNEIQRHNNTRLGGFFNLGGQNYDINQLHNVVAFSQRYFDRLNADNAFVTSQSPVQIMPVREIQNAEALNQFMTSIPVADQAQILATPVQLIRNPDPRYPNHAIFNNPNFVRLITSNIRDNGDQVYDVIQRLATNLRVRGVVANNFIANNIGLGNLTPAQRAADPQIANLITQLATINPQIQTILTNISDPTLTGNIDAYCQATFGHQFIAA